MDLYSYETYKWIDTHTTDLAPVLDNDDNQIGDLIIDEHILQIRHVLSIQNPVPYSREYTPQLPSTDSDAAKDAPRATTVVILQNYVDFSYPSHDSVGNHRSSPTSVTAAKACNRSNVVDDNGDGAIKFSVEGWTEGFKDVTENYATAAHACAKQIEMQTRMEHEVKKGAAEIESLKYLFNVDDSDSPKYRRIFKRKSLRNLLTDEGMDSGSGVVGDCDNDDEELSAMGHNKLHCGDVHNDRDTLYSSLNST